MEAERSRGGLLTTAHEPSTGGHLTTAHEPSTCGLLTRTLTSGAPDPLLIIEAAEACRQCMRDLQSVGPFVPELHRAVIILQDIELALEVLQLYHDQYVYEGGSNANARAILESILGGFTQLRVTEENAGHDLKMFTNQVHCDIQDLIQQRKQLEDFLTAITSPGKGVGDGFGSPDLPDLVRRSNLTENGLRLLSIDGGGVRGYVSLLVLKAIMDEIARQEGEPHRARRPADYFELAGGTSTGGLVCIMLFRLGMTVNDAIRTYRKFSEDIFKPSFASEHLGGFTLKTILGRPWYRGTPLEAAIKRTVREQGLLEDAHFLDTGESRHKTFVCSLRKYDNFAVRLRSYKLQGGFNPPYHTCTIWEAARATSAAPFYFPGAKIRHTEFWDGGLANNNPMEEVWAEKSLAYPQQPVNCVISLGTGKCETLKRSRNLIARHPALSRGGKLIANLTNVENVHRRFDEYMRAENVRYFRFNPSTLKDIGLAEYDKLNDLERDTNTYLGKVHIKVLIQLCAQLLRYRG